MIPYAGLILVFILASFIGWCLEVISRPFTEKRKFFNPGFLNGPYLPIWGSSVLLFYVISMTHIHVALKIFVFTAIATGLELVIGLVFLNFFKIRLWDYTKNRWNYKGLICPTFSAIWAVMGAAFYYIIYPTIPKILAFFESRLDLSFFIGLVAGIIISDIIVSFSLANRIRQLITTLSTKKLPHPTIDYTAFKEKVHRYLKENKKTDMLGRWLLAPSSLLKPELMDQIKNFLGDKQKTFHEKRETFKKKRNNLKKDIIKNPIRLK